MLLGVKSVQFLFPVLAFVRVFNSTVRRVSSDAGGLQFPLFGSEIQSSLHLARIFPITGPKLRSVTCLSLNR
jgi:hypothetical protein